MNCCAKRCPALCPLNANAKTMGSFRTLPYKCFAPSILFGFAVVYGWCYRSKSGKKGQNTSSYQGKYYKNFEGIQEIILSNKFYVVRTKRTKLTEEKAGELYSEHKNKFFYNRLVTFMCSGPIHVHILARENAVQMWRDLMGPTKTYQAQFTAPNTIRGKYGLSDTRNAVHGSDSSESTAREAAILFPDFDIQQWYKESEKHFRTGQVVFDREKFLHKQAQ